MEDLEPELDDILDIAELIEGRDSTDAWRNLEYLTQGLKEKVQAITHVCLLESTPHERKYINYLNKR